VIIIDLSHPKPTEKDYSDNTPSQGQKGGRGEIRPGEGGGIYHLWTESSFSMAF